MGNLCYLPKEIAVGIETEEIPGMTYSRLGKHHAKLIDDLWGGKCDGSRQYLERLIDYNPSLGLIDENDKVVAWILRYPLQYFPDFFYHLFQFIQKTRIWHSWFAPRNGKAPKERLRIRAIQKIPETPRGNGL